MYRLLYTILVLTGLLPALLLVSRGSRYYWGPAQTDLVNAFYPWRVFLNRWIERGIFPLWDPHVFHGYPVIESQQMAALHPVQLGSLWLFPVEWGILLQSATLCVIAFAAFTLFMRRGLRFSLLHSLAAANLWIYSAPFAMHFMAGHMTIQTSLASWPIALWGVCRSTRGAPTDWLFWKLPWLFQCSQGVTTAAFILAAVGNALAVLAGAPQFVIYLFYAQFVLVLVLARKRRRLGAVALLGLSWVLGLILSMPQWLPTFAFLPFSARGAGGSFTGGGNATLLAMGLEWLMPYPYGDDLFLTHMHLKNVWEVTPYTGAGVVVALFAGIIFLASKLIRRGRLTYTHRILLAGVMVSLLALAMIRGIELPGMASFREPGKARAVLSLGSIITVIAMLRLVRRYAASIATVWIAGSAIVLSLVGFAVCKFGDPDSYRLLVESFGTPFHAAAREGYVLSAEQVSRGVTRLWQAAAWTLVLVLAAAGGLVVFRNKPAIATKCLLVLLVMDVVLVHLWVYVPRNAFAGARKTEDIAAHFTPIIDEQRRQNRPPFGVILDAKLDNRTHLVDGLYENSGGDPNIPAHALRYVVTHEVMAEKDDHIRKILARKATGIRYDFSTWGQAAREAGELPQNSIPDNQNSLVELTACVSYAPASTDAFGPLEGGQHIISRTAMDAQYRIDWIEEKDSWVPSGCTETSATVDYDWNVPPHRVKLQTDTAAPIWAIYRNTWLPGWMYRLNDGDWQPAYCSNLWALAAPVPAGSHTLEFRYQPVFWKGSIAISLVGWGVLLPGLWVWGRLRRRPSKERARLAGA